MKTLSPFSLANAFSSRLMLCCCLIICTALFSGCRGGKSAKMAGFRFLPIEMEIDTTYYDDEVERLIRDRIMCGSCIFQADGEGKSQYLMKIGYYRVIDPKKLAAVLISAGMASVEAEFSYGLQISLLNGERVIKEYVYEKRQKEKTDSALSGMLSPFSFAQKEEMKVFNSFLDEFIEDVKMEVPLPFQQDDVL